MQPVQPGDVLVVRTPDRSWWNRLADRLIRFGAALQDKPNIDNHVVVVYGPDTNGTVWGIEARAGGVGRVDIAVYDNGYLLTNVRQPKTDAQRQAVITAAAGMLGVGYDWEAIGIDAAEALGLEWMCRDEGRSRTPKRVVCSALAAWLYLKAGLPAPPTPWRTTTPGDWSRFVLEEGWSR